MFRSGVITSHHCIKLHYLHLTYNEHINDMAGQNIAAHYAMLHYIAYDTVHEIKEHCTTLRIKIRHYTTLHYIRSHYSTLYYTP